MSVLREAERCSLVETGALGSILSLILLGAGVDAGNPFIVVLAQALLMMSSGFVLMVDTESMSEAAYIALGAGFAGVVLSMAAETADTAYLSAATAVSGAAMVTALVWMIARAASAMAALSILVVVMVGMLWL